MPEEKRPKRERTRDAKFEVWLGLALTADRVAAQLTDTDPATRPFAEWPDDDPLKRLCVDLDLTPAELARIVRGVAGRCEHEAERYAP